MKPIKIELQGNKIVLSAPYHEATSERAKRLGGRWDAAAQVWTFAEQDRDLVQEMCRDIWGADDTDTGQETVRLKCVTGVRVERKGVTVKGVPVARAFDRDGGARLEPDVIVLKGDVTSGGSRANWCTVVATGTVIELRNLPHGTAQRLRAWCQPSNAKASYHVVSEEEDQRAALLAERARLTKRLAEIEEQLGALEG